MKILDMGCGFRKMSGAIGVDFSKDSDADVIHDLRVFPYPFQDSYFDFIHCSHIVEHLPDTVRVMEEIHRIAKPGATVRIRVPHFSSQLAFANPTHVRYFSSVSFYFFTPNWKEKYSKCLFEVIGKKIGYSLPHEKFTWPINKLITFLANLHIFFCERIWCYWVGGMDELVIDLRVIK